MATRPTSGRAIDTRTWASTDVGTDALPRDRGGRHRPARRPHPHRRRRPRSRRTGPIPSPTGRRALRSLAHPLTQSVGPSRWLPSADDHHDPRPRRHPHRARAHRPARPRPRRTARRSRSSPARSPPRTRRPTRPTSSSCRVARASRRRVRRARRRGWMATGAARLPRPPARPARDRPLDAGRAGHPRRHARGTGRVPDPLPRRFDRPRRRGHPARARDRSLERPRPELRRLHLDDLPVDRARGPARGVHHRRPGPDRSTGRRHLRRDLRPRHRA